MIANPKEELYRLVDALPDNAIPAARRILEELGAVEPDEVLYTIETAPIDDEPETEEERAAVAEARAASARGEVMTTEELRRQLGL
jgi:hypothetical protein